MKNILVVYKKSLYELYLNSKDTDVKEFMHTPADVARLRISHEAQVETLEQVVSNLNKRDYNVDVMYRADLKPIIGKDLVVTVGGDGTLLEVAHYVTDMTPVLGVNSNPTSSVGYFSCATKENFAGVIDKLDGYTRTNLQRLHLTVDGQDIPELVLNDVLFAHRNPAAMTRYELNVDGVDKLNGKREKGLRSSGLLVCAAAGSTAWMYHLGGGIMPLDSTQMQYHERDQRNAPFGVANSSIAVRSLTREGYLYVDGEHLRYPFGLGSEMLITPGAKLAVVGDLEEKRRRIG